MEMKEENQGFSFNYSAKQQEEIKNIRKKYVAPKEDKMEQLRRLDAGVTKKASIASLVIGIIGALVLGFGMSLAMTELGQIFGSYSNLAMLIGVIVGAVGIVLISFAYPVYNCTLKKERERIAPEILRLTDDLMK